MRSTLLHFFIPEQKKLFQNTTLVENMILFKTYIFGELARSKLTEQRRIIWNV